MDSSILDKETFTVKLGKRVRKLRGEVGITQTELARRCYKDKQHMELVENGKVTCTSYYLYLISLGLEVNIDRLLDFSE